jgi:hypothetical protein
VVWKYFEGKNATCNATSVVLVTAVWLGYDIPDLTSLDSWRNEDGKAVTIPFPRAHFIIYEN